MTHRRHARRLSPRPHLRSCQRQILGGHTGCHDTISSNPLTAGRQKQVYPLRAETARHFMTRSLHETGESALVSCWPRRRLYRLSAGGSAGRRRSAGPVSPAVGCGLSKAAAPHRDDWPGVHGVTCRHQAGPVATLCRSVPCGPSSQSRQTTGPLPSSPLLLLLSGRPSSPQRPVGPAERG